jgi:hypothetical protein
MSLHDGVEDRPHEESRAEMVARMRADISPAPEEHPWCYVPEACEILGKSPISLQRWRSSGYGPEWSKNGNRVVYRRSDLHDWMLGRRTD